MAKPYYTANDLVQAVKRKIFMPISQSTLTEDDILAFLNEELMLSQVPSVMLYHEEYFVYKVTVPLVTNISRYAIPSRAIGMKLRDVFWSDQEGNFFEMTRIAEEDKAFFQRNIGANQAIHKYYLEGNEIVLTPSIVNSPTGKLNFFIFLRPNQLVTDDNAAIIQSFIEKITIDNSTIVNGDSVNILLKNQSPVPVALTYTAISSGTPTQYEFLIGSSSAETAQNLTNTISATGIKNFSASLSGSTVSVSSDDVTMQIVGTQNSAIYSNPQDFYIEFDQIPSNIEIDGLVDFLQTDPGHRTYVYDIRVQDIQGTIVKFTYDDLLIDLSTGFLTTPVIAPMVVGDYIADHNSCIIPQIPPDLHNGLAERACARILSAMGDQQGLQSVQGKISEIENRQGTLLSQRDEGHVHKVTARHSILRYGKSGTRRRY